MEFEGPFGYPDPDDHIATGLLPRFNVFEITEEEFDEHVERQQRLIARGLLWEMRARGEITHSIADTPDYAERAKQIKAEIFARQVELALTNSKR